MLEINLVPKSGNASGRSFPHSGYLGLSTVSLAGTFVAKRPALSEPLLIKSIQVRLRAYQVRTAGVFANSAAESVAYEQTQTLFSTPQGEEWQALESDVWEKAFKLDVPAEAEGQRWLSTATFKEWKVVWKLEAIVDYKPVPYIGSRLFKSFLVNLYNHLPPPSTPSTPPMEVIQQNTVFHFDAPTGSSFGPGDSFPLAMRIKGDGISIKKVTFWLERRLQVLDDRAGAGARETSPAVSTIDAPAQAQVRTPSPPRAPSRIHSLFHRTPSHSSPPPATAAATLPPAITQKIAEVAVDEAVWDAGSGEWVSAACMMVPRKGGKWDTGETLRTNLVQVDFDLFAKISLKSPRSRGTTEIVLPAVSILISSIGAEERAAARAAIVTTRPSSSNKRRASSRASSSSSSGGKRNLYLLDSSPDVSRLPDSRERRAKTRSPPGSPGLGTHTRPRTSAGKLERSHTPTVPSILRPAAVSSPTAPKPSISFAFPSPPPSRGPRNLSMPPPSVNVLPPISSFLPTPESSYTASELDYEALSLMRQFAASGRRISTTTSEEDELQPLRTRQRLDSITDADYRPRPSLPSLGALGLGLPALPEDDNRPSSASGVLTLSPSLGSMSEYTVSGRPHTASTIPHDSYRYRPILNLPHASPREGSFAFAPPTQSSQ